MNTQNQPLIDQYNTIVNWNGTESIDSTEAAIFERWVYCLNNVSSLETGELSSNPYLMKNIFNSATESGSGDDVSCSYWNQTCLLYATNCFVYAFEFFHSN